MSDDRFGHLRTATRSLDGMAGQPRAGLARREALRAALVPAAGGLLGGTFVGLIESLHVLTLAYGTRDYSGMAYAVLLYGALGITGGFGWGVLSGLWTLSTGERPEAARSWTLSFLAVSCSMGLVIGRFVVRRDILGETHLSPTAMVVLVLFFVVYAGTFYALARNALAKTFFSFLLSPLGSGAVYGGILLFCLMMAIGNMLDNRATQDTPPRPVAPELQEQPNLLFVVVDTLRADALGAMGAAGNPSPHFDRLAESGALYERAFGHSSWTRPGFASLWTSGLPCSHQTYRKADVLPHTLDTVAEVLQRHGYTTAALVNNVNVTASFNFHQGFDMFRFMRPKYPFGASEASFRLTAYQGLRLLWERYLNREKRVQRYYRDASEMTDEAIRWLRVHGQERWFLVVHYMDPHDPYFPHPADGTGFARVEHPRPDPEATEAIKALYRGEVRYWDEHFGRLIQVLEARGSLDSTAIVVTSDHGEEFGEHGGFWHGTRLYDEQLQVPLLVVPPGGGLDTGRRVLDLVRAIDVAPTLAEFAGAEPGRDWQGTSLLREHALRERRDTLIYAEADFEGQIRRAVRSQDWKLIENEVGADEGPPELPEELYFLRNDPAEGRSLARDPSANWALERRREELSMLRAAGCSFAVDRDLVQAPLTPEECEALRSLGYADTESVCRGR